LAPILYVYLSQPGKPANGAGFVQAVDADGPARLQTILASGDYRRLSDCVDDEVVTALDLSLRCSQELSAR